MQERIKILKETVANINSKGAGRKQRNCALKKLRAPLWKHCELRSAAKDWKSTGNACSPEMSVKVRTSLSATWAETWSQLYYSGLECGGEGCKVLKKSLLIPKNFSVRSWTCDFLEWWMFESAQKGSPARHVMRRNMEQLCSGELGLAASR